MVHQNLTPLFLIPRYHQTFYIVRQKISAKLKAAFNSPSESEKILADLIEATRKTLLHFSESDAQASKSFRELIERMEGGATLDATQSLSFKNLVEKLNQFFLQNLNTNK